jgi:NTP pyrophosphatase (non-canonical NTP hydrolase)
MAGITLSYPGKWWDDIVFKVLIGDLMDTFNQYQGFTESIANYNVMSELYYPVEEAGFGGETIKGLNSHGMPYLYPLLALAEEAGEVCGKVAKFVRKSKSGEVDEPQLRQDVKKELGDLLYQVSETARQFGFTLQDIVDGNVEKLQDRVARGVLIGEGDNR